MIPIILNYTTMVFRWSDLPHAVMNSLDTSIRRYRYMYYSIMHYLGISGHIYIGVFGNKCLSKIMGYRCSDGLTNKRPLRETTSRFVASIVRQHQLRLICAKSQTVKVKVSGKM